MGKWGREGPSNLPRVTQLGMREGGQTQTGLEVLEGGRDVGSPRARLPGKHATVKYSGGRERAGGTWKRGKLEDFLKKAATT